MVYSSINFVGADGKIPYPGKGEKIVGGHAIVAAGYDDKMVINNSKPGAFLIRNSWGKTWGEDGYGWLPYDYVLVLGFGPIGYLFGQFAKNIAAKEDAMPNATYQAKGGLSRSAIEQTMSVTEAKSCPPVTKVGRRPGSSNVLSITA